MDRLSTCIRLMIFSLLIGTSGCNRKDADIEARGTEEGGKPNKPIPSLAPVRETDKASWPMFGGTPQRNMVNTIDKDMPIDWSIKKDAQKNIKWVAELGSVAYGGPVVAGGRVFVGTNNNKPRDEKVKGDKGIIMCFDEDSGKFLWQAVHDKLKPVGIWAWQ